MEELNFESQGCSGRVWVEVVAHRVGWGRNPAPKRLEPDLVTPHFEMQHVVRIDPGWRANCTFCSDSFAVYHSDVGHIWI